MRERVTTDQIKLARTVDLISYMKQHFREPHFFIESAEGNDYFRVTPKVYDNLMGKPKKKPSREQGER